METILDILVNNTIDTEGLIPGQTPMRDENLSKGGRKTSKFKDTIQGIPIDWKAWKAAPADRKNFYYVKPGMVNEVIKRQYQRYLQNPGNYGLSDDSTLEDAIRVFDQQAPQNKIQKLKKQGVDVGNTLKFIRENFDLSKLNPLGSPAYAEETRSPQMPNQDLGIIEIIKNAMDKPVPQRDPNLTANPTMPGIIRGMNEEGRMQSVNVPSQQQGQRLNIPPTLLRMLPALLAGGVGLASKGALPGAAGFVEGYGGEMQRQDTIKAMKEEKQDEKKGKRKTVYTFDPDSGRVEPVLDENGQPVILPEGVELRNLTASKRSAIESLIAGDEEPATSKTVEQQVRQKYTPGEIREINGIAYTRDESGQWLPKY